MPADESIGVEGEIMNGVHAEAVFEAALDSEFAIPVYSISSSDPFERGVQHGTQAREQIEASIGYYSRLFEVSHHLGWREITERALVWEAILDDFDRDLGQEARGIAEGSGRSLGEILALNARGELVYAEYLKPDGCTSFAMLPDGNAAGKSFAGQNWDWRTGAAASRVILRIQQPPKPTITMVLEAGQLGRHGANSAGISVFANGLPVTRNGPGVPQAAIRRKTLDQRRFDDALDVVFGARQQIPSNVLVAHQEFAIDIETTPGDRRWGYPENGVITHANHFEFFAGPSYQPELGTDSLWRSFLLRQGLTRLRDETDPQRLLQGIGNAFANRFGHPNAIAVHPDLADPDHLQWGTLSSSIVDLSEGAWHIADGPADVTPYRRLPWNIYDEEL